MSRTFMTLARSMMGPIAGLALSLILASCEKSNAPTMPANTAAPLSADDVSWLFPAPQTAADFSHLIAAKDLTVPDPTDPSKRVPVWTDAVFANLLSVADSANAQVSPNGPRIGLPAALRTKDVWFVAGVRIDAGAPGLDPAIIDKFGRRPQIRLILQPVLRGPGGQPQVVDTAVHLIFDFVKPSFPNLQCFLFAAPDPDAFGAVVSDAATLRAQLAAGQFGGLAISTAGLPLGVHPGLANPATAPGVSTAMKALLERHIADQRLHSMALMSLPAKQGAPWIFVSMLRPPFSAQFSAVSSPTLDGTQTAMMLTPANQTPRVVPAPHTNNLAPMTCRSATSLPLPLPITFPSPLPAADRRGVSTADIFSNPAPDAAKVKSVTDLIADPSKSHFFNTDCVSCHTETRRAMEVLKISDAPGLSPSVMPQSQYNVRNFGWSPPSKTGASQSTATRRAANETAAVVQWLNAHRSSW